MDAELRLNANTVTSWLVLGAAPDSAGAVSELLDWGVTHVLDCRTPRRIPPPAATCSALVWCSAPTEDEGVSRGTGWYSACVAFAELAAREENARLYVHCAAGVNRAPAAAYTILRSRGWTASVARARILTCRAQARPRYFEDAEQCLAELGLAEQERA